jgi:Rap1a immunity proteins
MRKVFRSVLAVVSLGLSYGVWADFNATGSTLMNSCSKALDDNRSGTEAAGYCVGMVRGVSDVSYMLLHMMCPPDAEGVTNLQMVHVVYKYLKEHPEQLRDRDTALVLEALAAKWPCPPKP